MIAADIEAAVVTHLKELIENMEVVTVAGSEVRRQAVVAEAVSEAKKKQGEIVAEIEARRETYVHALENEVETEVVETAAESIAAAGATAVRNEARIGEVDATTVPAPRTASA